MAPPRSRAKARISNIAKAKNEGATASYVSEKIPDSKRDKRRIKHSILVSKAQASARVTKPSTKRRRPTKKLKAAQDLESLFASLPIVEEREQKDAKDLSKPKNKLQAGSGALVSRPGVQKRKDKLAFQEQDRFSKNLAMINTQQPSNTAAAGGPGHWAALREYITTSMKR